MTDFHRSTQDLIHEIERKDRRFRTFQAVSITLVGVGVIALLALNYNIQAQNRDLLDRQAALTMQLKKSVSDLETNNNSKLGDLQKHIDCIVTVFAQPNRASLFITDIKHCQLSSSGGATGGTKSSVSTNASQTKTAPANDHPGNKTGTAATASPPAQPKQGVLQRDIVQPIVRLAKGLF